MDVTQYCAVDPAELVGFFPDLAPFASRCRYTSCTHVCEEGCAVLEAVSAGSAAPSRQESYARLYRELKNRNPYP